MTNSPSIIFAAFSVTCFSSIIIADSINSFLQSIIPEDAPHLSTFWSFIGFVIFAVLAYVFRERD